MPEPRIVTPEEARESLRDFAGSPSTFLARLAYTVATEPDRTRAAVVAALREAAFESPADADANEWLHMRADSIENGDDHA